MQPTGGIGLIGLMPQPDAEASAERPSNMAQARKPAFVINDNLAMAFAP